MRTLGLKESQLHRIRNQLQRALAARGAADPQSAAAGIVECGAGPELAQGSRRHSASANKNDDKPVIRQYDAAAEADRALRPDELNNVSQGSADRFRPRPSEQSEPVNPPKKNLFSFDWLKKEQYATFTGEPPRASLTDPPPGYQTPSPDQPYGLAPEKKVYVPKTLGERMEPTR